ncbi:hypothetical protein LUX12_15395 [Streptomyces somaliensis]|uniref:SCO2584 family spore wall biosynthesis protein n=1 Tax=Streptomyces somaliensis TaxID=78355 RepID=UPI0020CDCBB5|nr:hypothetical protein [Streptomyces somaliensis]MCP9945864.1 hypothetical protein [Streptomyces somaliensis]MCP9973749.1 hypothetical protein [Streptomyces somaliensis]
MPDDVGGKPFPDGWEPDDDRGDADEELASVVFDEDFVRAAQIHEPTAVERLLAAAEARADAEAARARGGPSPDGDPYGAGPGYDDGHGDDPHEPYDLHDPYGPYGGALRPYRPGTRWYRPIAWLVALLMGLGTVALAFTAVYRGSSGGRDGRAPAPASSGVGPEGAPSGTGRSAPPVPAAPGTP